MNRHSSGFLLALAITLATYFILAAVYLDGRATTPADHAAAKALGVVGGACGIVALFVLGRRFLENDSTRLPGYVPPTGSDDRAA